MKKIGGILWLEKAKWIWYKRALKERYLMARFTKNFCSFLLLFLLAHPVLAAEASKSVSSDQIAVSLTVYNNDLGLVKDTRKIRLAEGQGELHFMDVASFIQPVTVHAESLKNPAGFKVLEQNYEYDLMSQEKILDKYVGKNLKIVNWNDYQDRQNTVEATLLSSESQIYRVNDEIYLGYPGYKVVKEIPNNLISQPTLVWLYDNHVADDQEIEVSYLTSGISWKADYVFVLDEKDTSADLSGWVTIDNRSGAIYQNASLKLIAGQVNRVSPAPEMNYPKATMMRMSMDASAPQFQEKAFFEYHQYDLQRKTTIKNNQTKQISLLEAAGVQVQKEYSVQGIENSYVQKYWEPVTKQAVKVTVKFVNSQGNHLGIPLPEGTLRLYKKDTDGSQQFVGEDSVKHTPADEEVKLEVGEAFDIVAERVQTDYQQISSKIHESEWEVTIRNHKSEDVTVVVTEPFSSDWKIVQKSHDFKKAGAFRARFDIPVPKKGEAKLKYRVRIEYK